MYDPDQILAWLMVNVQQMRPSRRKTLAAIVGAALLMKGVGVLAFEIVRIYKRRMWIEAMFRDLKNRDWGLGLEQVRLSEPERHDQHFIVLALAYVFRCAFGAAAETLGIARMLQANTSDERVLSLARIGNYFIQIAPCTLEVAFAALAALPA